MSQWCKNCDRKPAAEGDDFCSTTCAKIFNGVITPEDAKRRRKTRRRIVADDRQPWIVLPNPHVNRERVQGPAVRRGTRPIG